MHNKISFSLLFGVFGVQGVAGVLGVPGRWWWAGLGVVGVAGEAVGVFLADPAFSIILNRFLGVLNPKTIGFFTIPSLSSSNSVTGTYLSVNISMYIFFTCIKK